MFRSGEAAEGKSAQRPKRHPVELANQDISGLRLRSPPLRLDEIMLHSGIDLHKNDLVIGMLGSSGKVVKESRLRTQRAAVAEYFRRLPGPHRAVVEATASWYWLVDLLEGEGVELTLAYKADPRSSESWIRAATTRASVISYTP